MPRRHQTAIPFERGSVPASKVWGLLEPWERENWKRVWMNKIFEDGSRACNHFRRPIDFFSFCHNFDLPCDPDGWMHTFPDFDSNPMMEIFRKAGYDGTIKRIGITDVYW
jgi:hypothetical protein